MPIIGLNFDKLFIEKKKPVESPLRINSNLIIKDLKKDNKDAPRGQSILRFDFEYRLDYEPKTAEVVVGGHVLYSEKDKMVETLLSEWKKNKKVDPEVVRTVLNAVIIRSNVKALLLSSEIGLPPHIRFPLIDNKKGNKSYIG